MKFLLIILLMWNTLLLSSEIDERMIDVYFANGVDTTFKKARKNAYVIDAQLELFFPQVYEKYIPDKNGDEYAGKVGYAYNQTNDIFLDFIESTLVKLGIQSFMDIFFPTDHKKDINEQIRTYQEAIRSGHKVLVVAHSQGNLFTGEAFNALDAWMKPYFEAVSVASPRTFKVKSNTPHVAWNTDPVPWFGVIFNGIDNPHKEVGRVASHSFNYYMGLPDPETGLSTDVAKKLILEYMASKLLFLAGQDSQWDPTEPCLKISPVAHIEASSGLEDIPGVKIISAKGKLFKVGGQYVKADSDYSGDEDDEGTVTIPTAHGGLVTVGLSWLNNAHDMDLSFEAGVKDISSSEGVLAEHYFVETEDDISPGVYGIDVTGGKAPWADEACINTQNSTDIVGISVTSPGGGAFFMVETSSIGELDIGNVADLIVCEPGDSICPYDIIRNPAIFEVCNGDCEKIYGELSPEGYLYFLKFKLSQALNGPIAGAKINVYNAHEYTSGTRNVLFTGATTTGTSIYTAGLINFPTEFSDGLEDNESYVIEIVGGSDIDVNDDGQLDTTPTTNHGTMHALLSGKEIKNKGFKINILTEIAYQAVKWSLRDFDDVTLKVKLTEVANRLLKSDVNYDGLIDHNDLFRWAPTSDEDKLSVDFRTKLFPLIEKIYNNEDIYFDVYKLLYGGNVDNVEVDNAMTNGIHINLNSYVDLTQVQKDNITFKDSNGNNIDFTFTLIDGEITIYPLTEFMEGTTYTIGVSLIITDTSSNIYVDTQLYTFVIPDTNPPIIAESTIYIAENYVNRVPPLATDDNMPLTYTIIGGADKNKFIIIGGFSFGDALQFSEVPNYERPVDSNGDNVYELDISIADSFSNTTTQSIRIIIDDVVEGPELADTNLTVDENAPVGTYVGSVNIVNEGDGNLTEFYISTGDTQLFRINSSGEIFTKAILDFENTEVYLFDISAKNSADITSNSSIVQVKVNDIDESLPTVHHFTGSMDDHAPASKIVGQLDVNPGLDNNINMRLFGDGAEDFDINASGHITVSSTADLNHATQKQYDLKTIATNSYGDSDEANVTIYINTWIKQFEMDQLDIGDAVAIDKENSVFVSGTMTNLFVRKYSSEGELLWVKEYPEIIKARVAAVALDDNGTIYLAGQQEKVADESFGRTAAWIAAFSPDGDLLWSTTVDSGTDNWDAFTKLVIDSDGDLIAAGHTTGAFPGNTYSGGLGDVFVVRLSNQQEIRWIKQFGLTKYWSYAEDISINANGDIYLLASLLNTTLLKLEKDSGEILWSQEFTFPDEGPWISYREFSFDDENNIYLLGEQEESRVLEDGSYHYDYNIELTKLNFDGAQLWSKVLGSDQYEFPTEIVINVDNEIYVAGTTNGNLYNNYSKTPSSSDKEKSDFFLMQIDEDGNMLKTKQYGSIGWDGVYAMCIDTNNDILMMGSSSDSLDGNVPLGENDAFLMKVPH